MSGEFTIEYVELPNGRVPAREFVDSLDDKAAARIDAFIERLRIYGNRMQGKFVKKLTNDIFELRVKQFDRIFRGPLLLPAGNADRDYVRISEEDGTDPAGRDYKGRPAKKALDEVPKPLHGIAERKGSYPEGVGPMRKVSATNTVKLSNSVRARAQLTVRASGAPCTRLIWPY